MWRAKYLTWGIRVDGTTRTGPRFVAKATIRKSEPWRSSLRHGMRGRGTRGKADFANPHRKSRRATLTELRGFAGSEGSKSLILLDRTSKGLHYRSAGDHGSSAVIFGGGCAGNSSLRWLSSSRWSGSGSV